MIRFYLKLPFFFQNLTVTLMNSFVLNRKFGYIPVLNDLKKIQKRAENSEDVTRQTDPLKEINELIRYARETVPYFIERKNDYQDMESINDLGKIPVISKKVLKENNAKFISPQAGFLNSAGFKTSGTTGTPVRGRVKITDLRKRYEVVLNSMVRRGFDISRPYARFIGKQIFDDKNFYRLDMAHRHVLFSSFHLSTHSAGKYVEILNKYNIESIEGYPSVIGQLAGLMEENGLKAPSVKFVATTAEKLHDHQKALIMRIFNCDIFDYYGSNEQSPYIFSCSSGNYHPAVETGFIELMNDDGEKVTVPGQIGKMIVTSFTSHFMPLIRYEIGDSAAYLGESCCECKRKGMVLKEIIGRDEEVFTTLEGKKIPRFSVVLKLLPENITESQLILSRKGSTVLLKYVSAQAVPENSFADFRSSLSKLIGTEYAVEINKVDRIERSLSGKLSSVIIND